MKSFAVILFFVYVVYFGRGSSDTTVPATIVGGVNPANVTEDRHLKVAILGMGKLDALKGEPCERQVRKIVDAQEQVVAGTRYLLKAELCTPEVCEGKNQTVICDTCMLDLWEKPWINFLQVSKVECPSQSHWSYTYTERGAERDAD